jgi:hypothetical protein
MQVCELLFEERAKHYIKRLRQMKRIETLGAGYYAHVFQSPAYTNMVVKVFDPASDTKYQRYLRWCRRNQDNRFVPKIADVKYTKDEDGNRIGIVFMKKLRDASAAEIKKLARDWETQALAPLNLKPKQLTKMVRRVTSLEDWSPDDWEVLATNTQDEDVKAIALFLSKIKDGTDLHDGNVMVDPDDRQLVITDPIA